MRPKSGPNKALPALAVLALSLLLHAGLLLLPLPDIEQRKDQRGERPLSVRLLERPATAEPARSKAEPPSSRPEREAEVDPRPLQGPDEQDSPATRPPASSLAGAEAPAEPSPATSARTMRTQLLSAAAAIGREREQDKKDSGLQYDAIPALPSRTGWLNQYTGRVEPSVDRWRGRDGSRSARVVMAGGQVLCIDTRAPTTADTFNPWMSSVVPMVHDCGRQNPQALDPESPWVRRPRANGE